jgi:glycosidase
MALYASRSARTALGPLASGQRKLTVKDPRRAGRVAAAIEAAAGEIGNRMPTAGEIYALSRIEESLQRLVEVYVQERDSEALRRAWSLVADKLGEGEGDRLLRLFHTDFELSGAEAALREFPVWMAISENAAAAHATGFFLAGPFRSDAAVAPMLDAFEEGLAPCELELGDAPPQTLLDLLRAPARAAPESLDGQLRYVLARWTEPLDLEREPLLRGLDLLAEEAKGADFGPGPGPVEAPSFFGLDEELEQFSSDRAWMPSLVLLAKNVYVWLHQLSVAFDRAIDRVDRIPDEALDEIARRGFTGLWLIGVWERSDASRRLKQMSGNPEAAASAYSVRAYRIAADLGGEEAIADLRRRCAARGVRLAADMVPNHMGIDSDWVLDEPQRFLSASSSPFPAYTFTGADLSPRPEVGIYVEDHYFDHSDAAVVFKRVDRQSGEERFIYHGNDGTNMPWNDTAQLDYLQPETREAVIQTILEVARRFPIIRFDAAMTLARRHYQRLWFPAPGTGGDIPSRAERGLSAEAFAERMPAEFWREVVDRVALEAPDTLLLAEAFWLMEGYFVRTLGMHRVYNSAFMHMVRDQENDKYRGLLKETLAFDPRILSRYVSFLTNPDERTAIDQFGDGDRYFGACVLLATLPGLPMFGHGQVEGYVEKYGMEYRRSYSDAPENLELVARHEREISPLLRRRGHFAGVENFELYDFVDPSGGVNEDVFAYSNGRGEARSLVVFNNSFAAASGTIGRSAPREGRDGISLAEALGLGGAADAFWSFEDRISGSTYLRPARAAVGSGLHLEIPGFGYRVFEGFRVLEDDEEGRYRRLEERLAGQGVCDLDVALSDLDLEPAAVALRELFGSSAFVRAAKGELGEEGEPGAIDLAEAVRRVAVALPEWAAEGGRAGSGTFGLDSAGPDPVDLSLEARLSGVASLYEWAAPAVGAASGEKREKRGKREDGESGAKDGEGGAATNPREAFAAWLRSGVEIRAGLVGMQLLAAIAEHGAPEVDLLGRLAATETLADALERLGAAPGEAARVAAVAEVAVHGAWTEAGSAQPVGEWVRHWLADDAIRSLIGCHSADGQEWVRKEALESLANWRLALAVAALSRPPLAGQQGGSAVEAWLEATVELERKALVAGYRIDRLTPAAEPLELAAVHAERLRDERLRGDRLEQPCP